MMRIQHCVNVLSTSQAARPGLRLPIRPASWRKERGQEEAAALGESHAKQGPVHHDNREETLLGRAYMHHPASIIWTVQDNGLHGMEGNIF